MQEQQKSQTLFFVWQIILWQNNVTDEATWT